MISTPRTHCHGKFLQIADTDLSPVEHRDVLWIDIDDTLACQLDMPVATYQNQSLLHLMIVFAQGQGRSESEAKHRIDHIISHKPWWHWTDFLIALELDACAFWEWAYEIESTYFKPADPNLHDIISQLHQHGYQMFITSNNPSTGILHKLRLVGLADIWGSRFFLQYFSPCDLHHMKSEPAYWLSTLAHSGLNPNRIITIGDSWRDDVFSAAQAGLSASIWLNSAGASNDAPTNMPVDSHVWQVSHWQEILSLLTTKVLYSSA